MIYSRGAWFHGLKRQPLREPKISFIKDSSWKAFDKATDDFMKQLQGGLIASLELARNKAVKEYKKANEELAKKTAESKGRILSDIEKAELAKLEQAVESLKKLAEDEEKKLKSETNRAQKLAGLDVQGLTNQIASAVGGIAHLIRTSKCKDRSFDIMEVEKDGSVSLELFTKE
jgi:predicted RNase H-like nuclease (RuvC/YqgF family)